jgi:hypothetical protein
VLFGSPNRLGAGEGFRYAAVPSIFGGRHRLRCQDATHHVAREPIKAGRGEEIFLIRECQVSEHTYRVKTVALLLPYVELLLFLSPLSLSFVNLLAPEFYI